MSQPATVLPQRPPQNNSSPATLPLAFPPDASSGPLLVARITDSVSLLYGGYFNFLDFGGSFFRTQRVPAQPSERPRSGAILPRPVARDAGFSLVADSAAAGPSLHPHDP